MIAALARIAGRERDARSDARLALLLVFVAGAANAGGFMAVGHYTSHMTGIVSGMADDLALGRLTLVAAGAGALAAFLAGAALCSLMVNWARRRGLRSLFALPLALEAALLGGFGLVGALSGEALRAGAALAVTLLLCFLMGLQNAVITKLSGATIRTTHVTGLVTDLGIEIGRALYPSRDRSGGGLAPVRADRARLVTLAGLAATFFGAGTLGALGFRWLGPAAALPLAGLLAAIAAPPVAADLRR
ncbi:MAG: YoaK family protein [Pseudomonadota bacterium]|nr:YoaK family protein [Pseudomonadota bacterium]